jgi:hypothetical protein
MTACEVNRFAQAWRFSSCFSGILSVKGFNANYAGGRGQLLRTHASGMVESYDKPTYMSASTKDTCFTQVRYNHSVDDLEYSGS